MKHGRNMKHTGSPGSCDLRELEIDRVPEAIERRLRAVYAELPREVPQSFAGKAAGRDDIEMIEPVAVKRLPWPVRGGLGLAGAAAAAFVVLMGLNFTVPEFTESLPGLGGIFAQVNGKNPMGSNLNTYDDVEQVSTVALSNQDSGYSLTVDEAFCDGSYVYFTLEIDCPDSAGFDSVALYHVPAGGTDTAGWEGKSAVFTVNGQPVEPKTSGSTGSVAEGKIGFAYTLPLPESVEDGQEIKVALNAPALQGRYEDKDGAIDQMEKVLVDFSADFTVTANLDHNRIVVGDGQDNGVSILKVESTPGYIKINLEAPLWGYEGEEDLHGTIPKGVCNAVHLYTEDGQELRRNMNMYEAEDCFDPDPPDYIFPAKGGMHTYTIGFDGAPADCQKVVLRILEGDYGMGLFGKPETMQEGYVPNLFAELTIDLETGQAVPSETYLQEGMKKLDSEEYINTPHTPLFDGGYYVHDWSSGPNYDYVRGEELDGYGEQVELLADVEMPDVTLRFLLDGEEIGQVSSKRPEECTQPFPDRAPEWYEYREENGNCYELAKYDEKGEENKKAMGWQTYPQWRMRFCLQYEDAVGEQVWKNPEADIQVQVIDNATGHVICEKVRIGETFSAQ